MKPYRDITGITLMSAYSPVYNDAGEITAVVGIDLDLNKLLKLMLTDKLFISQKDLEDNKSKNGFEGFLFIVDSKGTIIAFPKEYSELFSLPDNYSDLHYISQQFQTKLSDSSNPVVKKFAKKIQTKKQGIETINLNGVNFYAGFSEIKSTNWKLGFIVSEERLIAPAIKTRSEMNNIERYIRRHSILLTASFVILTIILTLLFFRKFVFAPIRKIRSEVKRLGKGDFDIKISEEGVKEISEFASVFNYLGKELRDYMENLKKEISARERIEAEVKIAAGIQMSTLPELGEEFLRKEFDLSAKLLPALEASGDFYDFFYVSDNKIAILVADVAGKGIPAAFYMAMSKILLKSICMQEPDNPSRVLARVNNLLSQDNRSNMFLTVFIFYYDISTGKITYSNAGHHCSYSLLSNGNIKSFGLLNDMAIGFSTNVKYESRSEVMKLGEKIVLYTDGVVEASNPENKMYGDKKFEKFLAENHKSSCDKLSDNIITEIINYEKDRRFDDITVVIFQRNK